MADLISIVGYSLLLVYATWVYYQAVMNLQRVRDTVGLSPAAKVFGYPTLATGLVLDWVLNFTVFTVVFFDLPASKGELVTGRLKRYAKSSTGWRLTLTRWLASELLDDFDPSGKHI